MSKLQVLQSLVNKQAVIELLPNVRLRSQVLDPGLRATVVEADIDGVFGGPMVYCLTLDFGAHKEHNDKVGNRDYNPTGVLFVYETDGTNLLFKVVETMSPEQLRLKFEASGSSSPYVQWLEQELLRRM